MSAPIKSFATVTTSVVNPLFCTHRVHTDPRRSGTQSFKGDKWLLSDISLVILACCFCSLWLAGTIYKIVQNANCGKHVDHREQWKLTSLELGLNAVCWNRLPRKWWTFCIDYLGRSCLKKRKDGLNELSSFLLLQCVSQNDLYWNRFPPNFQIS